MRGTWAEGAYHLLMSAFLAEEVAVVPEGFAGHHVGAVRQLRPEAVRPHPTVMRILKDAGMAGYPQADIDAALVRDGIDLIGHLAGAGTERAGALAVSCPVCHD